MYALLVYYYNTHPDTDSESLLPRGRTTQIKAESAGSRRRAEKLQHQPTNQPPVERAYTCTTCLRHTPRGTSYARSLRLLIKRSGVCGTYYGKHQQPFLPLTQPTPGHTRPKSLCSPPPPMSIELYFDEFGGFLFKHVPPESSSVTLCPSDLTTRQRHDLFQEAAYPIRCATRPTTPLTRARGRACSRPCASGDS